MAGARAFWADGTGVPWLGAVDAAGGSGAINAGWADAVDMPAAINNKTAGMMRMTGPEKALATGLVDIPGRLKARKFG